MKKVTKVKMLLIMLCALFISVCSISCSDDDDNVLKVDTVAFISQLTDYQNQLETLRDGSQYGNKTGMYPEESRDIETDDARLQQVLINLLINATKFTSQGSIILELRKQSEQELLFSVTDTGCGIPKEKQAAIFRRFEKLNENAQGSGLGLSICQLIIEHIGGKIWIDSDYTGGSRFFFTHPIRQSQSTNPQKENNA